MKKRTLMLKPLIVIILILISSTVMVGQTRHVIATPEITVSGTSTLHDWDMTTKQADGVAFITLSDGRIEGVQTLTIRIPAESLKSGKGGLDRNAYTALKTRQHSHIQFNLREITNVRVQGNTTTMTAVGNLTIAGVQKPVRFNVTGRIVQNRVQFEGSTDLKMSDFNIDPPTAMMGTVRSGDDITVKFKVNFQQ